jgi:16S rRNA (uracil1498-N3)-methyltransferase
MTPFYISEIQGNTGILHGEEARHCVKVLRLKVGDEVVAVDGKGNMYTGEILRLGKERVEFSLDEKNEEWGEHGYKIRIWASPLHKADRFEWLVEKAVELGATEICPYLSIRTVKTGFRVDRMDRIAIAATKQCKRSRTPIVHEPVPLAKALADSQTDLRLIAWMQASSPLVNVQTQVVQAKSLDLFIGPEGGFSDEEAEAALSSGLVPISLGENRLRTETAAIHLLSAIKVFKQY